MKLVTAVIPPERIDRVTTALDAAGLTATTVASGHAAGLGGGRYVGYRGVTYRDQRCARLEILVSDLDVEGAVAILTTTCGELPGDLIVWASDVADLTPLPALASRDMASLS